MIFRFHILKLVHRRVSHGFFLSCWKAMIGSMTGPKVGKCGNTMNMDIPPQAREKSRQQRQPVQNNPKKKSHYISPVEKNGKTYATPLRIAACLIPPIVGAEHPFLALRYLPAGVPKPLGVNKSGRGSSYVDRILKLCCYWVVQYC
jgi:hypothetical protein